MKKLQLLLIILISVFTFSPAVFAASAALSVDKTSVTVGDTFKVSVNMKGAAAWNIHVSSTGPVKNCTIDKADTTEDAKDTNKTFDVTCTTTGEGTIKLTLSGDITSATDGKAVKISGSQTVKVNAKVVDPTVPDDDKEDEKPSTGTDTDKPTTDKEDEKPSTGTETDKPATDKEDEKPSTGTETDKPSTDKEDEKPSTDKEDDKPATDKEDEKPSTDKEDDDKENPETGVFMSFTTMALTALVSVCVLIRLRKNSAFTRI